MKKHLKKLAAILMPIALTLAPMAAMAEEAAPAEYYAEEDSWDDQMTIPGEEYDWIDDEEIEDIENVKDLEDWDDFFEEDKEKAETYECIACNKMPDFTAGLKGLGLAIKEPAVGNAADTIGNIINLANISRKEGILALEEAANGIEDEFLKKGINLVVDGTEDAPVNDDHHHRYHRTQHNLQLRRCHPGHLLRLTVVIQCL